MLIRKVFSECPCTITRAALPKVLIVINIDGMDIAKSITMLRVSRLYTRKALAEKTGIDLRHLIAVEEGREVATSYDIEAISRAFHVSKEIWLK